ncbi:histidine kinase [Pengzhenrongella sicca]|uniref:Histidine kinase n=1 Tax=Pengzhenrongella sicca TaxID=2819238 RepID=A0A8A4ZGR6_9MICO|nr:histidine kinase [Pengzhenrongella sicca]
MLVLGLVAVTLVLIAALALVARAQAARGAAQAAADLGALAAAEALVRGPDGPDVRAPDGPDGPDVRAPDGPGGPSGLDGSACDLAGQVVSANGATLTACRVLGGGVVRVSASVPGGLGTATASARAGPASAAG